MSIAADRVALRYVIFGGPTAAGKTELAMRIAEAHDTEIVSADAFQVYEGLDLLSAKPSRQQRERVPHHLIGIVPLTWPYDARQYGEHAREAIARVNRAGKVPLVVGGTGFYLQALTSRLPDLPAPDSALRARLGTMSHDELVKQLYTLDPHGFTRIDLRNPRRVLRAVEVCLQTGKPFSSFAVTPEGTPPSFVLVRSRAELQQRVNQRVEEMFAQGVVEEVAAAGQVGPTASRMIGFDLISDLLAGRISATECVRAIQQQTRQYARRQETWFRGRSYAPVTPGEAAATVSRALAAARPAL
ncbi:MAG: tRNA (adenosine(37)-N6)-dimethylallyltransferase MiaA [Verrucomicrobia bacterium]|nr:tRNA (adenosine(37)-N6)-dimethylallyltransferase MiaA [Verrucomicrobiota bacterium]